MYQEDAEAIEHERELVRNEAERHKGTGFVSMPVEGEWIEEDED